MNPGVREVRNVWEKIVSGTPTLTGTGTGDGEKSVTSPQRSL